MDVKLVNVTDDALELLIFTKSGRLNTGTTLEDIMGWNDEKKLEHLSYMMDTIKTSFEFVDYVFQITGVSRAFTHQVVRTRTASFQQQSQRTVDARDFDYVYTTDHPAFQDAVSFCQDAYGDMVDDGVPVQDARGVLPTNVQTEIFMKGNLRTFSNMAELRLCKRTQGEYQEVFKKMVEKILDVHPWAAPLLEVHCVKYGICAFPRYTKCPVQGLTFKMSPEMKADIRTMWKYNTHTANPVVNKNGMTM